MTYKVTFKPSAQKELSKLPDSVYKRAKKKILALADEPRPPGVKKLTGREGWRVRVGDWRIVYEIDDDSRIVRIMAIGHRGKIYRN